MKRGSSIMPGLWPRVRSFPSRPIPSRSLHPQILRKNPKKRAPSRPVRTPRPITNPDDPQKGRWGGRPQSNHRRLTAKVTRDTEDEDWFEIVLEVRSTDPAKHELKGEVRFHLHDTFPQM